MRSHVFLSLFHCKRHARFIQWAGRIWPCPSPSRCRSPSPLRRTRSSAIISALNTYRIKATGAGRTHVRGETAAAPQPGSGPAALSLECVRVVSVCLWCARSDPTRSINCLAIVWSKLPVSSRVGCCVSVCVCVCVSDFGFGFASTSFHWLCV